jgi:putative transposase
MSRQTSAGEAPVTLVCETFKVSRSSFYAASKAAPEQKAERQVTARRGVSTPELVAAIEVILRRQPGWGHRKVWAVLRRPGAGAEPIRVGRRRVYEVMRANGWTLPASPREVVALRGHVTVPEPNRRFATDLTTVWTRKHGLVAVVLTVDSGCRSVLDATATKEQDAPSVLASVRRSLVEAFGAPRNVPDGVELRTDHGSQYTGRDAAALAAEWRLTHTFAPVGRPTGNALAERTIQTAKVECLWLEEFDTVEDVQRALDRWRHAFNHERPHQALGWKTPAEVRAEKLGLKAAA